MARNRKSLELRLNIDLKQINKRDYASIDIKTRHDSRNYRMNRSYKSRRDYK